jgi:hypothetical protein
MILVDADFHKHIQNLDTTLGNRDQTTVPYQNIKIQKQKQKKIKYINVKTLKNIKIMEI